MTFTINIKEPAEKWLKKHNIEIQKRFGNKIRKLKENQPSTANHLRGGFMVIGHYILKTDSE